MKMRGYGKRKKMNKMFHKFEALGFNTNKTWKQKLQLNVYYVLLVGLERIGYYRWKNK